jgi:hypothetical protein
MPQATQTNGTGPAPVQPRRTIVRTKDIQPGDPLYCRLESEGQEVAGLYEPQWRYFLSQASSLQAGNIGDAVLYANGKLQAAMYQSGARVSDHVVIGKSKRGHADLWEVQVHDTYDASTPAERIETTQPGPSLGRHIPAAERPGRNSQPQPAAAIATDRPELDEIADRPASQRTGREAALLHAYLVALEIADHACQAAKHHHQMLLTPEFADIRAIAATLFIQAQGGK